MIFSLMQMLCVLGDDGPSVTRVASEPHFLHIFHAIVQLNSVYRQAVIGLVELKLGMLGGAGMLIRND